jgi:tetratricopeptide (TPR) repeat protein
MENAHPKVRDGTLPASPPGANKGPPKLSPAMKALNAKRREEMKNLSPEELQRLKAVGERSREFRKVEIESILLAADTALKEGNFKDALNLYANAEFLDKGTHSVGLWPTVGKMKALGGLGQHQAAMKIFATIEKTKVKKAGMGEAVLTAAEAAIALSDLDRAEALFKRVAHLDPAKDQVKKGLAKIKAARGQPPK